MEIRGGEEAHARVKWGGGGVSIGRRKGRRRIGTKV
jgi:hypothetical protein